LNPYKRQKLDEKEVYPSIDEKPSQNQN